MNIKTVVILTFAVLALPGHAQVVGPDCGSLANAYGPFDYTNPDHFRNKLPIVEYEHFDAGVESLQGHARHRDWLALDIDYTLRAFPNHHRALYAMSRYYLTRQSHGRAPMRYTAQCYFERAMAMNPADGIVRMIYGLYLFKAGDLEGAEARFSEAVKRSPEDPEVHYNLGLVLAKNKRWDEAREHAKRAYELGHPMRGLRNMLKRAGEWE
ncbi:MAG: tetratricopeptide repeat protein [Pseudomonadota bacterium]